MNSYLHDYHKAKDFLLELMREIATINYVKESALYDRLDALYVSLQKEKFAIVVVGEFSSGKSTFLNALIGELLLPSAVSETTATVNFIHSIANDDERAHKAYLSYFDGRQEVLDLATQREEFIAKTTALSKNITAREIERADLYYPIAGLSEDVVLVDSPGLQGMAEGHRDITYRQIEDSHACIYLISARGITGADGEMMKFIGSKFEKLFVIMNQIDLINTTETTVEEQVQKARENLLSYNIFPLDKLPIVYPISSFLALLYRSQQVIRYQDRIPTAEEKVKWFATSGINEFEEALYSFITKDEKARALLLRTTDRINDLTGAWQVSIGEDLAACREELDTKDLVQQQAQIDAVLLRNRHAFDRLITFLSQESEEILKDFTASLAELSTAVVNKAEVRLQEIKTKQDLMDDNKKRAIKAGIDHDVMMLRTRLEDFLRTGAEHIKRLSLQERDQLLRQIFAEFSPAAVEKILAKIALDDLRVSIKFADSGQREIDRLRAEQRQVERDISEAEEQIQRKHMAEANLQSVESRTKQVFKLRENRLDSLGQRPSIRTEVYYEEIEKPRSGLIGGFLDFFHTRTETVRRTSRDDSAGQVWDKQRASCIATAKLNLDKLEAECSKIANQIAQLAAADLQKKRLENKHKDLKRRMQSKQEEIERELDRLTNQAIVEKRQAMLNEFKAGMDEYGQDFMAKARLGMRKFREKLVKAMEEDFLSSLAQYKERLVKIATLQAGGVVERRLEKERLEEDSAQLADIVQKLAVFRVQLINAEVK